MKTWEELYDECASCEKCELHKTRTNCVFGVGNKNADILFVGEAPGEREDLSGTPFVGRAGQLLDKFLFAVDLKWLNCVNHNDLFILYLCHISSCKAFSTICLIISLGIFILFKCRI